MQVKFLCRGNSLIVVLNGELDHHSAQFVSSKIDSEIINTTAKNLLIDFSRVTFMDSSGIGVVVGRYKNILQLKGKLILINPSSQIKRIFEMSGILKQIKVYESIDKAISTIAG